jgi:hypothetical protein
MKSLTALGGQILGHTIAIMVGFALMIIGLALGVTMVLLPIGLVVGLSGVLVFGWGLLEWRQKPL